MPSVPTFFYEPRLTTTGAAAHGHRFKKKDEKLDKLKACMDVLDDTEAAKAEAVWDDMLTEVMKAIAPA